MDPTQTSAGQPTGVVSADAAARGQEIYDTIMSGIEPELTSRMLPTLPELYKDETAEQAEARKLRYEAAYAEYDKRYAQYMVDMSTKVHMLQRTSLAGIESDERKQEEDNTLKNLESSISTL